MLKYIIGFMALVAIVAGAAVAQAGCQDLAKSADEICVRANNHIPCLQDLSGKTEQYFCYNHQMPEDTFAEAGACRVLLEERPCGPDCLDYDEVDCCCFVPGARDNE